MVSEEGTTGHCPLVSQGQESLDCFCLDVKELNTFNVLLSKFAKYVCPIAQLIWA